MEIENELWEFAKSFYAFPEVSGVLLAMQEELGCSVNQLIFPIWLAGKRRRLECLVAEDGSDSQWRSQVTSALRDVRKLVKAQMLMSADISSSLSICYKQILAAELAAEQVELGKMYSEYMHCSKLALASESYPEIIMANLAYCQGVSDSSCKLRDESKRYWYRLGNLAISYFRVAKK